MKLHGLPDRFWIVLSPSLNSTLGDIRFECDFKLFALQIRGGLDEEEIVAVFADEEPATELAESLLRAIHQAVEEPAVRIQRSPWPNWFATQGSLAAVVICNKETDEQVVIEPPREWGRNWGWNICEDGLGIVMLRTP
jgi:hypothetical protein